MTRAGEIGRTLFESAARQGAAHLVLVDPDRVTPERASELARERAEASADAILIGSSTPPEREPALMPTPVAVGGGIRHPAEAAALVAAGARLIVTGTAHERGLAVRPFTDAVHDAAVAV